MDTPHVLTVMVTVGLVTFFACLFLLAPCVASSRVVLARSDSVLCMDDKTTLRADNSRYSDVPSKSYIADFVFEGTALELLPDNSNTVHTSTPSVDIVFEAKQAMKADVRVQDMLGDLKLVPFNVTITNFTDRPRALRCKANVTVGETYIVYASIRRSRHKLILTASAFPDLSSKETRRAVKSVSCSGCGMCACVYVKNYKYYISA